MRMYPTIVPYRKIPEYIIPPRGWRNLVLQAGCIMDVPRPNAAKLKKAKRLIRLARHYRPGYSVPKARTDSDAVTEFIQQSLDKRRAAKAALQAPQS